MVRLFQSPLATATLLATLAFIPQSAFADPSISQPDGRVGCIIRSASGLRFFDPSGRDRKTLVQDIVATTKANGPLPGISCIAGQVRNMPAPLYAKLAALYPGRYAPLALKPLPATATQAASSAQPPRYKYLGLDGFVPSGFYPGFAPVSITEGGSIFGWIFDTAAGVPYIAVFERGSVTPLQSGLAYSGSRNGIVGGALLLDLSTFQQQAALYRGNSVELVPPVQGQFGSFVALVNDQGTALINWSTVEGEENFAIYKFGAVTKIDFGSDFVQVFPAGINNNGIIAGWALMAGNTFRGFRYNTRTGERILLNPLPSDHDVFIGGINESGDVVGTSLVLGGVQHIGFWRGTEFVNYFTEGTPEIPAVGYATSINDRNLIVVSDLDQTSTPNPNDVFLVPSPGQRFSMNALTGGVPPDLGTFPQVFGVNNRGKIIGTSQDGVVNFLLEPTP
ncbi:hypothetical protein [Cupriavidus sp. CuC1]|uniref:hypothetical protein n=1 Tax=Cupriavidus sp. CuC1 TaxID=3373131 RepID=UPI0037CEBB86